MRIFILISFLIVSILGLGQTQKELRQIDRDYSHYLKSVFEPTFKIKSEEKSIPENLIFGDLENHEKDMAITNEKTFSVSFKGDNNKLIAAILHGVHNFSTYQFLADDYEQLNQNKDLVIKEYLRVKVHIIPDTNRMELINSSQINRFEQLNLYKVKGYKKPSYPYVVSFFTSHQETGSEMNQTTKITIKQNGKIIYSSNKIGSKVIVRHNNDLNNYNFVYKSKGRSRLISGGLMNYAISNIFSKIKDKKHLEAKNVSNVRDSYKDHNKDLKRISNTGRLTIENSFYKDLMAIN